jgi:hypothetical protein
MGLLPQIRVLTQQAHSSWSVLAHRLAHRRPKKSRSMKQTPTRRGITPARTTKESCNKHTSVLLAVYTTFSAEFTQTKKLLPLRLRKSAQASKRKSVEGVKSETRGEWDFRSTKRLASKWGTWFERIWGGQTDSKLQFTTLPGFRFPSHNQTRSLVSIILKIHLFSSVYSIPVIGLFRETESQVCSPGSTK